MRTIFNMAFAGLIGLGAISAFAEEAGLKTVATVYQDKTVLAGKTVRVQGKVVKVNNGIMGRNFVHVRDGSGDADSNNLIVTSKQTAAVGDQVTISGIVVIDRDFGSGYNYPLLIEEATIVTGLK
jgi:hypothetical protein